MYNINQIVENKLCVSCCSCKVLCPVKAIEVHFDDLTGMFTPTVDTVKCTNCGMCLKVCPSNLFKEIPYKHETPKASYACFSKDRELRWNSTSGGFVTQLIAVLLHEGVYHKAFVVKYDCYAGEIAKSESVTNVDDLYSSAKSKYIPVSVERIIDAIKKNNIGQSIIVCTPCQLMAIRNAFNIYKIKLDNVLFIGLFCERMFNYKIYDWYRKQYGFFDKFYFRGKETDGWPGNTVLYQDGKAVIIDRSVRMSLKKVYPVNRCNVCNDKLNNKADISCGDCYDSCFSFMDGTKQGVSSVIVRTHKGELAFDQVKKMLIYRHCSFKSIEMSQKVYTLTKWDRIIGKMKRTAIRVVRFINGKEQ